MAVPIRKPAGGAERIKNVKTARFAKIVERCGPPETHLVLLCEHLTRNQMFAQVIQRDLTSARRLPFRHIGAASAF